MGVGMAKNLIKAGFTLTVYNRTRAKAEPLAAVGARVASTAAEAARNADVLQTMSQTIVHLGAAGSGARLKLINNFLCGVQLASVAEALVWIERSGLDREQALNFLTDAAPGSPLLAGVSARMVERVYNVNFLLPLMQKDMQYAQADARSFDVDLRTAAVAASRLEDAMQAGLSDKDMSAVVEPIRTAR